ncbi:hypothetical protein [Alteromonas stellipolaris]|uniref:hypothetical protein n=1 Tax=Alteromonas stellipolaris TaxID=233316 RepID=UPI0026E11704|nr:hypothetical protein [Alteromonas stellipolaris]MDO6534078.1 hypothetical protein [Alteromonas stellipolaris]MDO6626028.1 hypothetical protein [Alteromonas stellipolaris]
MTKLIKLKRYFSLNDSASFLSSALEEQVSLADIYELSLEGHLAISIRLTNQAYAKKVALVPDDNLASSPQPIKSTLDSEPDEQIHALDGIYDLAMIGEEKFEIRKLYQKETQGASPILSETKGFFIEHENHVYQLLESLPVSKNDASQDAIEIRLEALLKSKGHTTQNLLDEPSVVFENLDHEETTQIGMLVSSYNELEGSVSIPLDKLTYQFVIRAVELNRFVSAINNPPLLAEKEENTIHPPEKRSYLKFIRILLHAQKIEPAQKGTSSAFRFMSESAGISLCSNTIRKILSEAEDI